MISIEAARSYYSDAESGHDFDHALRVLALAERIARAEGGDLEVVRAAALLHDVGRSEERRSGQDHAVVGAERAQEILAGRPRDKIARVAEAIAAHRFRSSPPPTTSEARALFDADKLDAMGAIGIARAFAYAGAHDQRLWAPRDSIQDTDCNGPGHTPIHEFVFKLSRLLEVLTTPTGRALAAERHAFMATFFARLEAEATGEA